MSAKLEFVLGNSHDETKTDEGSCWTRRSDLEKRLLLLLVLLFVVVLGLAIATGIASNKNKLLHEQIKEMEGNAVCLSTACVRAATYIAEAINSSADPCENFHVFACGNWEKKHPISEDQAMFGTTDYLSKTIDETLRDLLSEPIANDEPEAIKKAKMMYESCVDEVNVRKTTNHLMHSILSQHGDWPIITPNADVDDFDWISVETAFMEQGSPSSVVSVSFEPDLKDPTKIMTYFVHPKQYLDKSYLREPDKYSTQVNAYKQLITDVAMSLAVGKVSLEDVTKDVNEMVQLEIDLCQISLDDTMFTNVASVYNDMTIKDLQVMTDHINGKQLGHDLSWLRLVQEIVKNTWEIEESETIVVLDIEYFKKLGPILAKTDNRVLSNYMLWGYVYARLFDFGDEISQIYKRYLSVMYGIDKMPDRWTTCLAELNAFFDMAVGRLFVQSSLPPSSKAEAEEMVNEIKNAFRDMLDKNEWISEGTKQAALQKEQASLASVGYPDWILDNAKLNAYFEELNITEENYAANQVSIFRAQFRTKLMLLRNYTIDRTMWVKPLATVNAIYNPMMNSIQIHAGFLQTPFFTGGSIKALNFGSIGSIIGHEITHGFDNTGRQFDKQGNVAKWWSEADIAKFNGRAKCFVNQYASYCPREVLPDMCVNGNLTLGENIADNGGLKAAYKGYRNWVSKHKEEDKLPGLDFTPDQLFFLAFGQTYCASYRPQGLLHLILQDTHSPNNYRIVGTLSNSQEFANAFNCPAKTAMNRGDSRCEVW